MDDTLAALLHELAVGCTYGYGEAAHAEGHKVHAARLAARGVHVGCDMDLAYEAGRQDGAHEATQPAPDALREAAHIVEQQGLALGRLREAARDHGLCSCADFGGPRPLGGGREYHYSGCDYDPALRAALEEADRGYVAPIPESSTDPDHILDGLTCWCRPYRDPSDPETIWHRREARG